MYGDLLVSPRLETSMVIRIRERCYMYGGVRYMYDALARQVPYAYVICGLGERARSYAYGAVLYAYGPI